MTPEIWTAVDEYIEQALLPADAALDAAQQASAAAGLPAISVSPAQGKLLHLIVRMIAARRVLEIGTLGGYSAIWMARALPPGGRLVTLELDPRHAAVARRNIAAAGLSEAIAVREGRALELLPTIAAEAREPFDLVFIDADKPSNAEYFDWALRMTRPGGVIVVDNVVRRGAVTDVHSSDANVRGVRALFERLARERNAAATAIQTVGRKGYDGFVIAIVNGGSR